MIKSKLSNDKSKLQISINMELTTEGVETLLADLALLRGQMVPEVTRTIPNPNESQSELRVSVQSDPDFAVKGLVDGRTRLWIRNRGLGWLVFNFTVNQSCSLRDYLIANTPNDQTAPNFFTEKREDTGISH